MGWENKAVAELIDSESLYKIPTIRFVPYSLLQRQTLQSFFIRPRILVTVMKDRQKSRGKYSHPNKLSL
jgi:hypothetical protein